MYLKAIAGYDMAGRVQKEGESKAIVRRRGAALEVAILTSAWEDLKQVGYAGMTLESVAARAQTSRTVLSRRWSSRAELARAAVRFQIDAHPLRIPNSGSLREDLLLFLRSFIDRATSMLLVTTGELAEYYREEHSSPADLRNAVVEDQPGLESILERALERGEIDRSKLTPRLSTLPIDLLRHDLALSLSPPSDEAIREVVDDIFLPLVTPHIDGAR